MPLMLVDTDVLSAIMRRRQMAIAKAAVYLSVHNQFSFSIITRYEILRGLKAKNVTKQIAAFERLCASSNVIVLTDAIVVKAAEIYAEVHRQGRLIGDADILIAASALPMAAVWRPTTKSISSAYKAFTLKIGSNDLQ